MLLEICAQWIGRLAAGFYTDGRAIAKVVGVTHTPSGWHQSACRLRHPIAISNQGADCAGDPASYRSAPILLASRWTKAIRSCGDRHSRHDALTRASSQFLDRFLIRRALRCGGVAAPAPPPKAIGQAHKLPLQPLANLHHARRALPIGAAGGIARAIRSAYPHPSI